MTARIGVERHTGSSGTEVARLAVESRYFPLVACDHGEWRITFRPKQPLPVSDFLATQGRFSHLSSGEIATVQSHIDERWELLASLESPG
jgi:pyruvate ferredoxin oxidoreductase beta subunit